MTTQEKLQLVQLAREVQWVYALDNWQEAPLRELLRAVRQSQTEILAQIEARAATLSEWREERSLALLDEMSNMTLGLRNQLGESIAEITAFAGAESYLVHNDILSFGGMVNGFNNVALTASQIKSMVVDTPVGGRVLQTWIDDAFDWQIKDRIKQEIASGMLQGEGYPKMVARLRQGLGLAGDDAVTVARSYVQAINVHAAHDVAKANSEFMKGWKWRSAAENGAFYVKSGKGKGRGICMLCLGLDAADEVYPMDGGPEIPAHPRCRCLREYVTKSWRDLGIPVDEIDKAARPYTIRGRGIDPETGEIQPMSVGTGGRPILGWGKFLGDYEDFFKTMDLSAQRQTIGPRRLELYQAGKIKGLGDLVVVEGGKARLLTLKELKGEFPGKGGLGGLGGVKVSRPIEILNGSETHVAKVNQLYDKLPQTIKASLNENGVTIKTPNLLTDAYPELKGVQPRGYPEGITWDYVGGLNSRYDNTVVIAENMVSGQNIKSGVVVKQYTTENRRVENIFFHEVGHAFDHRGIYSESRNFTLAYEKDIAKLSNDFKGHYNYVLQQGVAGRQEAFAEMVAALQGHTSYDKEKFIKEHFPSVAKYVKGVLEK